MFKIIYYPDMNSNAEHIDVSNRIDRDCIILGLIEEGATILATGWS